MIIEPQAKIKMGRQIQEKAKSTKPNQSYWIVFNCFLTRRY